MRKQLLLSWSKTTAQQDIFWRLPTQLLRTTLTASQKRLFTDEGDGEKIQVYQASDERDEARGLAPR